MLGVINCEGHGQDSVVGSDGVEMGVREMEKGDISWDSGDAGASASCGNRNRIISKALF